MSRVKSRDLGWTLQFGSKHVDEILLTLQGSEEKPEREAEKYL